MACVSCLEPCTRRAAAALHCHRMWRPPSCCRASRCLTLPEVPRVWRAHATLGLLVRAPWPLVALFWRGPVERSGARESILAHMWAWRNAAWRRSRRIDLGSASVLAGRLGSRVVTHVYPRWEDSLPAVSISRLGERLSDGTYLVPSQPPDALNLPAI